MRLYKRADKARFDGLQHASVNGRPVVRRRMLQFGESSLDGKVVNLHVVKKSRAMQLDNEVPSWLHRPLVWGIQGWQMLVMVFFYFGFGALYWLTLHISSGFRFSLWQRIVLDYSLKAALTLPIWWLLFRRLGHWPASRRLLLHIPLGAAYVIAWRWLFRLCCDWLGERYLTGNEAVWDIYIPSLFYLVQFGVFHSYEYLLRERRMNRRAQELQQLVFQSEINALKAQIQPHFLFNTLNSISASVPPQLEHTRELIAKLADVFRFGLLASRTDTVPLRDEIAFLKNYLDLEKQRFGDRLSVQIEVPGALLDTEIPPMLLQPLVENAVKHAVGPSVKPVSVRISVQAGDGFLSFEVADTGMGIPEMLTRSGSGTGLYNTRMRLEKQFGEPLLIQANTPRGICISFRTPAAVTT